MSAIEIITTPIH